MVLPGGFFACGILELPHNSNDVRNVGYSSLKFGWTVGDWNKSGLMSLGLYGHV